MSFRENTSQQMTLFDSVAIGLTDREKKALDNSWAHYFAEDIFPNIDEKPYAALYSDKPSRSNTPVNVCIGALILKELHGISDDALVENILLDVRYQYALHTTSFAEQPVSDKTMTRFRNRCYQYEAKTGVDLIHATMTDLAEKIAKLMDVSPDIRRMDSMMIESNIRKLSRLELIYTCIAKLCKYIEKKTSIKLPEGLAHYTEDNDFNKVVYHNRSDDTDDKMLTLLKDADALFSLCGEECKGAREFELFSRCMGEQTVVEGGSRRLATKEDGTMGSSILQNPSDPDATFRSKAGKEHRGYVANVVEDVGTNGSVVTDYQFEDNTYSDSQFLKDYVGRHEPRDGKEGTLVADGAYSGDENVRIAEEKGVKLTTTDLTGKDADPITNEFVFNEGTGAIEECPAGNKPTKSRHSRKTGKTTATFPKHCCEDCPNKKRCKSHIHARVANVTISDTTIARAKARERMESEEFKNLARIRNGVETIPSILRRLYNADKSSRGKARGRLNFGFKIGALNFKKLIAYRQGRGNYAQNPLLDAENA